MLFVIHIVSSHSTDEDNYNKNVSISMRTMTIFYRHVLNEMWVADSVMDSHTTSSRPDGYGTLSTELLTDNHLISIINLNVR